MKERKIIYRCDKFFFVYSEPKFELFLFDDGSFGIDYNSIWLEGTKDELTLECVEDIVDNEDYSHYILLGKFYVDFQDGIYITNWLNKT